MSYMDENWCTGEEKAALNQRTAVKTAQTPTTTETPEEKEARVAAIVAKNEIAQKARLAEMAIEKAEADKKEAARQAYMADFNARYAADLAAKKAGR